MSNCVLAAVRDRSCGSDIPGGTVADHGVEGGDDLSHDGDDGDLRFLSSGCEAVVEGFEGRIVATGSQGGHVEHSPDGCAPAPDGAHPFHLAAVEVIGREPDDGRDLLAAHLAKFRQQRDKSEREDWTNTRHRGQEPITFGQGGIGGDHLGEPLVEQCDVQRDTGNTAAVQTPEAHICEQPRRILGSDLLVTELPPRRHDLRDPLGRLMTLSGAGRHGGDEQRDHASIKPIVLGQNPTRLCKLAELEWVDLPHGNACCKQGASNTPLVAPAGFDSQSPRCRSGANGKPVRPSLPHYCRPKSTGRRATASRPTGRSKRRYQHEKGAPSSYPILADAGSCPCNCSGVEEETGAPSSLAV